MRTPTINSRMNMARRIALLAEFAQEVLNDASITEDTAMRIAEPRFIEIRDMLNEQWPPEAEFDFVAELPF